MSLIIKLREEMKIWITNILEQFTLMAQLDSKAPSSSKIPGHSGSQVLV
jgi:hypothetical protein